MTPNRRCFLKLASMAGIGLANSDVGKAFGHGQDEASGTNKVTVDYAVATLEDGSMLSTPFWRVESGREGPSLLVVAAQHGNEVHGVEVARRLKEVCARRLVAGSVWLVPVANLPAVRRRRHSVDLGPEQPGRFSKGHNMQRTWPGDPEGNNTERLASALHQAVLRHCSHAVDIHCWNQFWAAETLAVADHEPSRAMGEATTTRFISYSSRPVPESGKMMLSQLMRKRGAAVAVIELSGQFQMQERQVRIGLSSMVNIAKLLGMVEGEPERIDGPRAERTKENSREVHAPCPGVFMPALRKDKSATLAPEDFVEEGQTLGHILRESDLATVPILAPASGYLWQFGMCHGGVCDASLPALHPYAEAGEKLAQIMTV